MVVSSLTKAVTDGNFCVESIRNDDLVNFNDGFWGRLFTGELAWEWNMQPDVNYVAAYGI